MSNSNNQVKSLGSTVSKAGIKMSKSKLIELISKAGKQEFNVVQSDSELIVYLVNVKS